MQRFAVHFSPAVNVCEAGLILGSETRLARFADGTSRLTLDADRLSGLLSVAFRRSPTHREVSGIASAATHWQLGDKALANLRLAFSGLPRLEAPADAYRLKAAEMLFDAGVSAAELVTMFGLDLEAHDFEKYDPAQPRVPAGSGPTSGRWTDGVWSRFSAWLDEQVPERDQDTGLQVGTQSRARAILTSPLAVGLAGVGALFGGEALLPAVGAGASEAAAVVPAADETELLSPLAQRYLSVSGGRLGGTATRRQLYDIALGYVKTGKYDEFQGDGMGPEEYIRGPGPGTRGSTYVDFTAKAADGTIVRVQTINTLSDSFTPTVKETAAAARIRTARPSDQLILIPKTKP